MTIVCGPVESYWVVNVCTTIPYLHDIVAQLVKIKVAYKASALSRMHYWLKKDANEQT